MFIGKVNTNHSFLLYWYYWFLCIVDNFGGRLYWTDRKNIISSKLDGTDEKVIISSTLISPYPWGIVSHGNDIYFSDLYLGKIFKLDKTPGSSPVAMYTAITEDNSDSPIFGFVLYSRGGKLLTLVYKVPQFY